MKALPLALAGLLIGTAAMAQPSAPPSAPGAMAPAAAPPPPSPDVDAPPPPPPGGPHGPRGDRAPPPPRGAAFMINRGPNGEMRLDVHCAERDTTKECADIAARMLDRVSAGEKGK